MALPTIAQIPLSSITPPNFMLRDPPTPGEIAELADSIQSHGLIEPIVVRPIAGKFELVAGYRRYLALRKIRMNQIPAVVNEVDNATALIMGLSENLDRRDASPLRMAEAIQLLTEKEKMSTPQIGKRLGKSAEWVSRMIRLSKTRKLFVDAFASGFFSLSHVFEVMPIRSEEKLQQCIDTIVEKRLSMRETRKLVQQLMKPKSVHRAPTEAEEHGEEGAHGLPAKCGVCGRAKPLGEMHKVVMCVDDYQKLVVPILKKQEGPSKAAGGN